MLEKNKKTIAVIGLGLIGGSLLKSLKGKGYYLIGVSRSEETLNKAKNIGIADEYSLDVGTVKNADIVFICAPINKIISIIDEVSRVVNSDCIITDVASIKGFIVEHVNNFSSPVKFIGGHPMAGTENKGVGHAVSDLFKDAKWVLTPSKWSNADNIEVVKKIIGLTGAKVVLADPHEHDRAVAMISHMPLLLSEALIGFLSNYENKNISELAFSLAASGFRDTTRLAATNPELAKDMLLANKANVKEALNEFKNYLIQVEENLDTDEEKLENFIKNAASTRSSMYSPAKAAKPHS